MSPPSVTQILVVEDDPDAWDLTRTTLEAGLQFGPTAMHHAPSLEVAKAVLQREGMDLVVLDLGLPDAPEDPQRLGALRVLLELPDLPPVVCITANVFDRGKESVDIGAAGYVNKIRMVTEQALAEVVTEVLAKASTS